MAAVIIRTARLGGGGLNITRGSGRGTALAFAPTWEILRPVLASREDARANDAAIEAIRQEPIDGDALRIAKMQDDASDMLGIAFATFKEAFLAEMLVSSGEPVPADRRWEDAFESAYRRGCRCMRGAWDEVIAMPEVTLECMCHRDWAKIGMCHRVIVAQILCRIGKKRGIKVEYAGEI